MTKLQEACMRLGMCHIRLAKLREVGAPASVITNEHKLIAKWTFIAREAHARENEEFLSQIDSQIDSHGASETTG